MAKRAPQGLIYVTDDCAGIRRVKSGKGFSYKTARGKAVRDAKTLNRIKSLAIPPAWSDVWICSQANAHLQATGRDARGRKQHRYHPRFRAHREGAKFEHLAEFAAGLPALRRRVSNDLRRKGLPREKVIAAIVELLDKTLIRAGNDEYAKANKSYGLTTLQDRHAQIRGDALRFVFMGKSGKQWRLTLKDRRVAKVVKAAQDLPGQRLFQYVGEDDAIQSITSTDVNAYLRDVSGRDITSKDFRTWGATVLAAAELARLGDKGGKQANVRAAIETCANTLGNTPTVCRKSYVDPRVVDAYLDDKLKLPNAKRAGLSAHEARVMAFLNKAPKRSVAR